MGLIGLRLHVDVVEDSLKIFIIVVLFLLVIIIFVFFLVIVLIRIVQIIAVIITVITGPAAILIVLFVLSAEVLRWIVLTDSLAAATLRYLILQALLETVGHLMLFFLLMSYLLLYVAVLGLWVDRRLGVTLPRLVGLLALADFVQMAAVRAVVATMRHRLVTADLVL